MLQILPVSKAFTDAVYNSCCRNRGAGTVDDPRAADCCGMGSTGVSAHRRCCEALCNLLLGKGVTTCISSGSVRGNFDTCMLGRDKS